MLSKDDGGLNKANSIFPIYDWTDDDVWYHIKSRKLDFPETYGWTMPIVVRPDYTIIDGFHRWTVSGREPLLSKLGGKVPIVIVKHKDEAGNIYGTITHNRARGTHLLGPMKNIISRLLKQGKTIKEISKQLGMSYEEVFRLSDFSREEFLEMMARTDGYSKAKYIIKY